MAVACTFDVTTATYLEPVVVSYTGLETTTDYVISITHPDGFVTPHEITSDESGEATFTYTPKSQGAGTITFDARPASEHNGTTTPADSTTLRRSP